MSFIFIHETASFCNLVNSVLKEFPSIAYKKFRNFSERLTLVDRSRDLYACCRRLLTAIPGQCSGCVWVGISNQDRLSGLAAFRSSKSPGGSHYILLKWVTRRCYTRDCRLSCLLITGRLPWQPAGIKFTHCVSGQKSAFSPLQEKLCVGSKNDWHLLELSRRPLSACKVWGRSNYARRL